MVDQCQLTTASSHREATDLPAVSLTHKVTTSSLASGSSHIRRRHNHRARIRAKIIKDLKGRASSVVVPGKRPQSVN